MILSRISKHFCGSSTENPVENALTQNITVEMHWCKIRLGCIGTNTVVMHWHKKCTGTRIRTLLHIHISTFSVTRPGNAGKTETGSRADGQLVPLHPSIRPSPPLHSSPRLTSLYQKSCVCGGLGGRGDSDVEMDGYGPATASEVQKWLRQGNGYCEATAAISWCLSLLLFPISLGVGVHQYR